MHRSVVVLALALSAPAAAQDAVAPTPELAPGHPEQAEAKDNGVSGHVLTLGEAVRIARTQAPVLRAAHADTQAAEARVAVARAPLLPQLTGTASYQRTTANFVLRPGAVPRGLTRDVEPSFDTFNFYNFGATASQLIYDFGGSTGTLRASKESAVAQRESERATTLDVDLTVRTAFFRARATRALVKVAKDALANQERHLAQAQALVDVGSRPPIDAAQARTDVANARVDLIRAENEYALAKAELNQAMGIEGSTEYEVSDEQLSEVALEDASTDALMPQALLARPELAELERRVRAQEITQRAVRGGYGPSLSVSTTITDAGTKIDDLTWNWNAGVLLSWPLISGGATIAQSREARATLSSLVAQRDVLKQSVRLELERARLAVRAAKAVISAADEAVSSSQQRLELAEGRYQAGVGNIIELGDAQLALAAAQAQRVGADYDLATARAALLRALGQSE